MFSTLPQPPERELQKDSNFKTKLAAIFIAGTILIGMGFKIIDFNIFSKTETCLYLGILLFPIGLVAYSRFQQTFQTHFPRAGIFEMRMIFSIIFVLFAIILILGINIYTDSSLPEHKRFQVINKHIESHKNSRSYYVDIARPDFVQLPYFIFDNQSIRVPKDEYDYVVPNASTVALMYHKGTFGLPWYDNYVITNLSSANIYPSMPKGQISEDMKAACVWNANFNVDQEIEKITPDNYIRDFWPNGAPRSVEPTVNGLRHGIAHYTFANGALYADIPWKNGQKHGPFKLYREDGSLDQSLSYKDGVPYGVQEWFNRDGSVAQSYVYLSEKNIQRSTICRH